MLEQVIGAIGRLGEGTVENSKNAQQAADGSRRVTRNIVELDNKTRENDDASGQALDGAKRLLDHPAVLQRQVHNFLRHVRAA